MKLLCLLALCSTAFASLKEVEVNQEIFIKNGAGHSSAHGGGSQLKLVTEYTLPNGVVKQKHQQYFNGVPVANTAVVTTKTDQGSVNAQGIMYEIDDSQGILSLTTISKEEALEIAKLNYTIENDIEELEILNQEVELTVDPTHGEVYELNFLVEMDGKPPHRPYYLIGASDGKIKDTWEGIDTENAGGPGGNLRTKKYTYGASTKLGPLDVKRTGNMCYLENKNVKTVNLNHASSLAGNPAHRFPCPTNNAKYVNGAYSPLNDAHYFGGLLYRMFNDWAKIPPLKFQLVLRVHYKSNYQNAFWDGRVMTFGDGGSTFYPLVDINVVTHEAAHGFTGQNSGLKYKEMSGGMNEAYSDIAGESAEAYARGKVDWMVGADIYKRAGAAMRYFEKPERNGRSIGHASKYNSRMDVHYSSGVYNRAYYLIVTSGKYSFKQAFILFTTANKLYWTASSTFNQGACGVERAAKDLGYDVSVVTKSFATVGVQCKPTGGGGGNQCITLTAGNSRSNSKTVLISSRYKCPKVVDKTNWLGGHTYPDRFSVNQIGDRATVKRLDANHGWGMNLQFKCCPQAVTAAPTQPPTRPPTQPPTRPPTAAPACKDISATAQCQAWKAKNYCRLDYLKKNCKKTCGLCGTPPTAPPTKPPTTGQCATLNVGNSRSNSKSVSISSRYVCPKVVDKTNWLGGHTYPDRFSVNQIGNWATVKRLDASHGWGMKLQFKCCTTKAPACRDLNSRCSGYKTYCNSSRASTKAYMKKNCAKTCNMC